MACGGLWKSRDYNVLQKYDVFYVSKLFASLTDYLSKDLLNNLDFFSNLQRG